MKDNFQYDLKCVKELKNLNFTNKERFIATYGPPSVRGVGAGCKWIYVQYFKVHVFKEYKKFRVHNSTTLKNSLLHVLVNNLVLLFI